MTTTQNPVIVAALDFIASLQGLSYDEATARIEARDAVVALAGLVVA